MHGPESGATFAAGRRRQVSSRPYEFRLLDQSPELGGIRVRGFQGIAN